MPGYLFEEVFQSDILVSLPQTFHVCYRLGDKVLIRVIRSGALSLLMCIMLHNHKRWNSSHRAAGNIMLKGGAIKYGNSPSALPSFS